MARRLKQDPAEAERAPALPALLREIRACEACAPHFSHRPRPVLQASASATLCIVGQAPGTRVHASGQPFTDRSGERLRDWLGMDSAVFYDARRVAIVPMGFCFPGQDARGADKPPRRECARLWRAPLFALLPRVGLTLLVGQYAQRWHLGAAAYPNVTETVAHWRDYMPRFMPLPHPSWRNHGWLKRNPWFADDLLPALKLAVRRVLASPDRA